MFIYKIVNNSNGKIYIGQTIKTIKQRFIGHIKAFRAGEQTSLYFAFNKYGFENFTVTKICNCYSKEQLNRAEIYFIKKYNSTNKKLGYNMKNGGACGLSAEGIEKMRKSLTGKKLSDLTKEKIRKSSTGRKLSQEARNKISEANRKRVVSDATKLKISKFNKGKTISVEQRQKQSAFMIGNSISIKKPKILTA